MILTRIDFGRCTKQNRDERMRAAEDYLCTLYHTGQVCSEYTLAVHNGKISAYLNMTDRDASAVRYHSRFSRRCRSAARKLFGVYPKWVPIDDDMPGRITTWKGAPYLYLFTHAFDCEAPLCRGDNGKPIPSYRLGWPVEEAQGVYFWQEHYSDLDRVWFASGSLEIPAYKEMADPRGELAREGRELCGKIQKTTGLPVYYYMMRFHGRRRDEEKRKCPLCGRGWRVRNVPAGENRLFHHFAFRCDKCRLVSHLASSTDDERYAHIGEYRPSRRKKGTSRRH